MSCRLNCLGVGVTAAGSGASVGHKTVLIAGRNLGNFTKVVMLCKSGLVILVGMSAVRANVICITLFDTGRGNYCINVAVACGINVNLIRVTTSRSGTADELYALGFTAGLGCDNALVIIVAESLAINVRASISLTL